MKIGFSNGPERQNLIIVTMIGVGLLWYLNRPSGTATGAGAGALPCGNCRGPCAPSNTFAGATYTR